MGRDTITGGVVLVASIALYWATFWLEHNPLVPIGPAFYPRIVLAITAAFAAALVAVDVVMHRRYGPAARPRGPAPRYAMVVLLFAIFGAYVLALPLAGFRLATFAFVAVMQVALEPPRTPRRWALVAAVALAATAGTYYVFDGYLKILLPRGSWTGF